MLNKLVKSHIVVAQNASGRTMNVPVYQITGKAPGPNVYIQSSIHGAEVQGNVVIYHLIQLLQQIPLRGTVTLVPNCNPVGTNIKAGEYTLGRFDPVNGTNWNRGYYYNHNDVLDFASQITAEESVSSIKQRFRLHLAGRIDAELAKPWGLPLAQQLNLSLQRLSLDADIVLDLHNGPVSTRHMYVPEYATASACYFNFPHCIVMPNKFAGALDEATFCPWWTLTDAIAQRWSREVNFGIEAFTLEMGSQEVIEFDEGAIDAQSILCYLNYKGVLIDCALKPEAILRRSVALADYRTLYTNFGGMVEYCAKPGIELNEGDLMARILNIDELDNEQGMQELRAPCKLIPVLHFPSASVLSGTQLYKCMTNYQVLTNGA